MVSDDSVRLPGDTAAALRDLHLAVGRLLATLTGADPTATARTAPGLAETAETVECYWTILKDGCATDDAGEILRGANLLTTVNRGVADDVVASALHDIGMQAFEVTKRAKQVAKLLRGIVMEVDRP